jgi:TolB-like protein
LREEFKRALAASSSGISATVVEPSVVRHKPRWLQAVGATVIALLLGLAGWRYHSSSQGGGFFAPVRSVAVMNFRVEAGDQQAQVIAQGLPEELTNALSKAGIQVAAHSSVTELGPSARGRDVGAQLRVDGVIEGTVRSYGTRFKVNAELMDVQTGFQRWSGSYTVDAGDLLAGEQKVAGDISRELRSAIGSSK